MQHLKHTLLRLLHAACLCLTVSSALAQQAPTAPTTDEPSVAPGINERYKTFEDPVETWIQRFEGESREVFTHREKILQAVNLQPGQAVADIGAGTGLFTLLFAQTVGRDGKVYAVDIVPDFLKLIDERAAQAQLPQIKTVLCKEDSVELLENSIDLAFICDTYHHFEYPKSTLASIHKALRPGGRMIVIDFKRIEGESSEWVLSHVRAGEETFTREIIEAGFEPLDTPPADFLQENYLIQFRKPEEAGR